MLNIKVLGALVACALIVAVPSLAHGGPVVGHPLAKGTMQATTPIGWRKVKSNPPRATGMVWPKNFVMAPA